MQDESQSPENPPAAWSLVQASWSDLLEDWPDEAKHHEFVALCDELDMLDWATERYAQERLRRGSGDPSAEKMERQILFRAQLKLQASAKEQPDSGRKAWSVLLLLALLVLPLVFLVLLFHHHPGIQERLRGNQQDGSKGDSQREDLRHETLRTPSPRPGLVPGRPR